MRNKIIFIVFLSLAFGCSCNISKESRVNETVTKLSSVNTQETKKLQDEINDNFIDYLKNGSTDRIQYFINSGIDLNKSVISRKMDYGFPLMIACLHNKNENVIFAIIDAGADVNISEGDGYTPLMYASRHFSRELVNYFLTKGARINETTIGNENALTSAAANNPDPEVMKLLLSHGADVFTIVDHPGYHNVSVLMIAAKSNPNPEIIDIIIDCGVDVKLVSSENKTAIDYAESNKCLVGTKTYDRLKNLTYN